MYLKIHLSRWNLKFKLESEIVTVLQNIFFLQLISGAIELEKKEFFFFYLLITDKKFFGPVCTAW